MKTFIKIILIAIYFIVLSIGLSFSQALLFEYNKIKCYEENKFNGEINYKHTIVLKSFVIVEENFIKIVWEDGYYNKYLINTTEKKEGLVIFDTIELSTNNNCMFVFVNKDELLIYFVNNRKRIGVNQYLN
ncbi:MAG: hypothetical protein QXL18_05050 [Candidatus Woesearchaeota archaeon]